MLRDRLGFLWLWDWRLLGFCIRFRASDCWGAITEFMGPNCGRASSTILADKKAPSPTGRFDRIFLAMLL